MFGGKADHIHCEICGDTKKIMDQETAPLKLNAWELLAIEKALDLVPVGIIDTWSLNRLQEKIKRA
tara:strand:- start:371 stop:568 length:198 start_codon:yes stop_codon:yes gene_type:complete